MGGEPPSRGNMITEVTTASKRAKAFDPFNERVKVAELDETYRDGLADNLTHYMAEFLLKIPITSYIYNEETVRGQKRLLSPGFGPRDILETFTKPYLIKDKPSYRDWAEAQGFHLLEQEIFNAQDNSYVIFISPPPEPGGYSITYLGQVKPIKGKPQRLVEMVACFNNLGPKNHESFLKSLGLGIKSGDLLLSPGSLSPGYARKLGIDQLSDLVLRLYSFTGKADREVELDFVKAKDRLSRVKQEAILPHLDEFINLLRMKAPNKITDAALDFLELEAIKSYYQDRCQIGTPQTVEYLRWAGQALVEARKNMPEGGGSCPAAQARNDLIKTMSDTLSLASQTETETRKCPSCATDKDLSVECCRKCRYR